ncbi:hypothetical protein H5203_16085 [Pseudoalteromonas sp. SG41-1]|uniref:hypothetical protein n=1 Tax=Pseudoalteromonas sp. SG41-1 TaxID=2760979 RepID=UPI0016006452|nr:hypothetical protein [Pseudoalteromonas sp. SG41-1]MBB1506998.1 hypothetical protein [Pseudoalteromonas sp. SG41-1]
MNQYARSTHFNEYMRKEQFNQSINDDIKQISMSGYRSKPSFSFNHSSFGFVALNHNLR